MTVDRLRGYTASYIWPCHEERDVDVLFVTRLLASSHAMITHMEAIVCLVIGPNISYYASCDWCTL